MTSKMIPCPCGGSIPIAVDLLIAGKSFSCPNCHAAVSLAATSRQVAGEAISELARLKSGSKQGKNRSLH